MASTGSTQSSGLQGHGRLGQALRAARTDAGRTLEQVSTRTRIRTAVLRDLEAGELASSGGPVYARGHVRSVAQALGVDPAPLLAVFDEEAGRQPAPVVVETTPLPLPRAGSLGVPAAAAPERRGPHWGGALVAALSVLVGLLAVGTLGGRDERTPAAADDLFAAPSASAAPLPTATARPLTAAVPVPTGARLRVRVLDGSSWIRVQGARGTLFEGVVAAGQAPRDFTDPRELRLLVGNAAAVSVVCGSRDLAPAGSAGAVRRFTCSASGLVAA